MPTPVGGAGDVDDARLLGRPDPAALLSPVCGRVEEVHQQAGLVGTPPRDPPPIQGVFDARDLRSRAFGTQAASENLVGSVAVGCRLFPQTRGRFDFREGGRRGEYVRSVVSTACFRHLKRKNPHPIDDDAVLLGTLVLPLTARSDIFPKCTTSGHQQSLFREWL